jgi:thiol-disulfide isomerase/thioredoxin
MNTKTLLIAMMLAWAPGAGFAEERIMSQPTSPGALAFLHGLFSSQPAGSDQLASLAGANDWLNSPPLGPEALRGKVVLVEFLTYTCINWLRQLPYVRAWAEKYKDRGLVVIGVHTPEFPFKKNANNVRLALKTRGIAYPVAVDSDYAI